MKPSARRRGQSPASHALPFEHAYPRPLLERASWSNLNGQWDFAIDAPARWTHPDQVKFNRKILVPFAPETPASGIEETGYYQAVWYRRAFDVGRVPAGQRVLLHFGAVDYDACVWVNNQPVVRHEGGYTPFCADVTDVLNKAGPQTLVVHAKDDPLDLSKPRGKQDWLEAPHGIWYYRTTGIWQTVWLEVVPEHHLAHLRWAADAETFDVRLEARVAGRSRPGLRLSVCLICKGKTMCDDSFVVDRDEVTRTITLPDPGIDDARNAFLWFPWNPVLIEADLKLQDETGRTLDHVKSYTALRQAKPIGKKFVFNGKPLRLDLVLDQGYWPESGLTAPSDDAYRRDVELAKQMGFNGVRKHQKIENPRFLYWADKLGLMVWEEMPSAYRFNDRVVERVSKQWMEAVRRDVSHPCIIAWMPFNESWGVPDLPTQAAQRAFVQSLYSWTKAYDPTRMVIGNDGWENGPTDVVGIHDYEASPAKIAARYADTPGTLAHTLATARPGNKLLVLDGYDLSHLPVMLTEFGGIAYHPDSAHTWGYSRAKSTDELANRYFRLLAVVRNLSTLSGYCYTQFTDTFQEANGLLTMNRQPKFSIEEMAVASRGPIGQRDHEVEQKLKERAGG